MPNLSISRGQSARIMTGAPLPPGADAVIMLEDTDFNQNNSGRAAPQHFRTGKSIQRGENVRPRGMDLRAGDRLLSAGDHLSPQALGLLAMIGAARLDVHRKPRVALLSSGDELIPIELPLQPGKIHDSNSYMLSAMLAELDCEVFALGVAPDQKEAVAALLDRAIDLSIDLILTSAGISVGAFDFLKEAIQAKGSLDFWRVNMRPGKPLAFGEYRGKPLVGLPGNPVSAFVGFEVFVRPALTRLAGARIHPRVSVSVRLAEPVSSDGRESYLRAIVEPRDGILSAKLTGHQGSGNLLSLVQANALLIIPAGVKSLAIGAQADAWLL